MSQADGTIIIDTEIKTDDVASDVNKISDSLGRVKDSVKNFGHNVTQSFTKAVKSSDLFTDAAQDVRENVDKLKSSFSNVAHPIQFFKSKLSELWNEKRAAKNEMSLLNSEYKNAKSKVADLTKKYNESARTTGRTSEETKKLHEELEEAKVAAKNAEEKLDSYSNKVKKAGDESGKAKGKVSGFFKAFGKVSLAAVGAAATAVVALTKQSVDALAEYEQLAGGVEKIFNEMDSSKILDDADRAYQDLGMSANQYLAVINDTGATFASTMGDEAGYKTARQGLLAIADFASGTGKNVDELSEKFTLITRSTASYQSIADQFSGVLPQTSADFLKQAQAAGLLSKKYEQLTEVPVAEYQAAVSAMLEKGVANLGLAGNTAKEATTTISGSLAALKAQWSNLLVAMSQGDSWDIGVFVSNFAEVAGAALKNLAPAIKSALVGMAQIISSLAPIIAAELPGLVSALLPELITAAMTLLISLIAALPSILSSLTQIIPMILTVIMTNLPMILESAIQIILTLINGIIMALPMLAEQIPQIVLTITNVLWENFDVILDAAIALLMAIIDAIPVIIVPLTAELPNIVKTITFALIKATPQILKAAVQALMAIIQAAGDILSSLGKSMLTIGKNIVEGIWSGISNGFSWIKNKIRGWVGNVVDFMKNLFGIHSPSRLMRDEIGKYLASGVAVGFEVQMPRELNGMEKALGTIATIQPRIPYAASGMMVPAMADMYGYSFRQRSGGSGNGSSTVPVDVAAIIAELRQLREDILNMRLYLNGNQLVGGIINDVDRELGYKRIAAQRGGS